VEQVPPTPVRYRKHEGVPHLVAKSCRELSAELKPFGFDLLQNEIFTFADNLEPGIAMADIHTYVGAREELSRALLTNSRTLGGGNYLCSRYEGTGDGLGDHWMRLWAEAVPASRRKVRKEASYQELTFSPDPHSGVRLNANLFIPVQ
jgi:DNA gyrase inhibitor GyrI